MDRTRLQTASARSAKGASYDAITMLKTPKTLNSVSGRGSAGSAGSAHCAAGSDVAQQTADRRQWTRRPDVSHTTQKLDAGVSVTADVVVHRRAESSNVNSSLWSAGGGVVDAGTETTDARSRQRRAPQKQFDGRPTQFGVEYLDRQRGHRGTDEPRMTHRRRQQIDAEPRGSSAAVPATVDQPNSRLRHAYTAATTQSARQTSSHHQLSQSPSPPYWYDNKTLLKEAIITAAAAKLARSSSARSATTKPVIVVRNGPAKSSSDEHVETDDIEDRCVDGDVLNAETPIIVGAVDTAAPTTTITTSTAAGAAGVAGGEVALIPAASPAVTAAAAAAASRRTRRQRRREPAAVPASQTSAAEMASQTSTTYTSCSAASTTGMTLETGRTPASVMMSATGESRANAPVSTARRDNVIMQPTSSAVTVASSSSPSYASINRTHFSLSAAGPSTQPQRTVVDSSKSSGISAENSRTVEQRAVEETSRRGRRRITRSENERRTTSAAPSVEAARRQSPNSSSKVSFIKNMLTRTRSPSPRRRAGGGGLFQTSSSPSAVRRLGAEMAQRISEPFKGYIKQLRDRSAQRRRGATAEAQPQQLAGGRAAAAAVSTGSPVTSGSCTVSTSQSERHTADASSRNTDTGLASVRSRDEPTVSTPSSGDGSGASTLSNNQWKSTSELTTPMSRLDCLLKANSLQHLQAPVTTAASLQSNDLAADERSRTPRSAPVTNSDSSVTSRSVGCLLTPFSLPGESTRSGGELAPAADTSMTRCYLEKPPQARKARRAMTVQLDRRPANSSGAAATSNGDVRRQFTSEAELRDLSSSGANKDKNVGPSSAAAAQYTDSSAAADDERTRLERRQLRELYEQKRLERQLEEKLARMEKERADVIAKLWSQLDSRSGATNARPSATNTVQTHHRQTNSATGIIAPLSLSSASHRDQKNEEVSAEVLDELLGELNVSSTVSAARAMWAERRGTRPAAPAPPAAAAPSAVALRPRAASCSRGRHTTAATDPAAAATLTAKSRSHTHLHRSPSSSSDAKRPHQAPPADAGHLADSVSNVSLRSKSSQQQQSAATARPLTCYMPVLDRSLDLRRFVETAGHRLDQCELVQLTASTCHGFLSKLSRGATAAVRQWKRRWFVFDRTRRCLHYYADKTERRADAGAVWFQTIQDVFVDHVREARSPRPDSTFCVKTVDRALFLMAPTPEAMRIWIDVIFTGAEAYQQFA